MREPPRMMESRNMDIEAWHSKTFKLLLAGQSRSCRNVQLFKLVTGIYVEVLGQYSDSGSSKPWKICLLLRRTKVKTIRWPILSTLFRPRILVLRVLCAMGSHL